MAQEPEKFDARVMTEQYPFVIGALFSREKRAAREM